MTKAGFLLINKPAGPTSHDIIDELRRITGERRIGHAGTLDPFAGGLLICAIGREATRQISKFSKMDKTYVAKLRLGAVSDTYDKTGQVQVTNNELRIKKEDIEKILKKFVGEQKQVPPMYSAKKIKGQKLYELARKGLEIPREPAEIKIDYIKILDYKWPELTIETWVSSGTYIRSLAHDIGQALGCGAYLEELTRTAVGDYKLKDAIDIANLTSDNFQDNLF